MRYFLEIFRTPRDIHRVILAGVISLLLSHVIYLYEGTAQSLSIVHTSDYLLISLFWAVCGFTALWTILSSKRNLVLYGRIFIIVAWTFLGHRLVFGVESAGSFFYNLMFVIFATSWMPFAIAGMTPSEVIAYFDNKNVNDEPKNVVEGKFNAK